MSTDRYYLESAMQEAEHAYEAGTYPIGAIIVDPTGEIIGRGYNHVYCRGDYTSHAEMEAIRDAGRRLMEELNFEACTLYTTMEPCLMCCGAILIARIARVIWLIDDDLYGALRCLCNNPFPLNALSQKEKSECSISENHFVSEDNSDEGIVNSVTFQGGRALDGLYAEKITSPSILPAGYTGKIACLSILPAGEDDLAQRMCAWLENWNVMKENTVRQWR